MGKDGHKMNKALKLYRAIPKELSDREHKKIIVYCLKHGLDFEIDPRSGLFMVEVMHIEEIQ